MREYDLDVPVEPRREELGPFSDALAEVISKIPQALGARFGLRLAVRDGEALESAFSAAQSAAR